MSLKTAIILLQKFKNIIFIISLSFLLSSCSSWFGNKTIEYDEEVKLSDGSMIWVHIKRHYTYVSAIGQGSGYKAGIVEISWDTGFDGVGRKSVFFDDQFYFIDKIADEWYIVGYRYPYEGSLDGIDATNCRDVGALMNKNYDCVFRINSQGEFVKKPLQAQDFKDIQMNVFYTYFLDEDLLDSLDDSKLSWSAKLELQNSHIKERGLVGKPYSYLIHKDQVHKENLMSNLTNEQKSIYAILADSVYWDIRYGIDEKTNSYTKSNWTPVPTGWEVIHEVSSSRKDGKATNPHLEGFTARAYENSDFN